MFDFYCFSLVSVGTRLLLHFKIVVALNLSSLPISDEEVVLIVLEGLGSKYDSFVASIMATPLIPFQLLQGLLQDQEHWLAIMVGSNPMVMNLVTIDHSNKKDNKMC